MIELTVIAPGKQDMELYEWFIKQSTLSGRILIQLPPQPMQNDAETKEILFEEATCFSLEEGYHIGENQRRVLRLSLVADEININGVMFYR
jgi:hypothetical protein